LAARDELADKWVSMTLGRMPGRASEKRYDVVIEVLPDLLRRITDLMYLLGGDGPARLRLDQKAAELGVKEQVVFAGIVANEEKA
jgi:1,2-diacylglycerol 3-alpha-glucosyltransferase